MLNIRHEAQTEVAVTSRHRSGPTSEDVTTSGPDQATGGGHGGACVKGATKGNEVVSRNRVLLQPRC